MALPRALPRLARLVLSPRAPPSPRACSGQPPRDACEPTPAPPCPPCAPQPRPPCRARSPDRVRALRVTCCPPPRGCRPPCSAPLPACAITCEQARPQKQPQASAATVENVGGCDGERDRVSARLATAREARRRDYLREARERRPPAPPADPLYQLPAERPCARATDGRHYALRPGPPASVPHADRACGPCREPPPSQCIEIMPTTQCEVREQHYVDPCAHKPRVFVSIARPQQKSNTSPQCKNSGPPEQPASFSSRTMKSFSNRSGGCDQSNSRQSGEKKGKAQFAGDSSWCGALQPAPAPARCRPLPLAERLRRRACRDIPCQQHPPNARQFHTNSASFSKKATKDSKQTKTKDVKDMATQTKANVQKLEQMLNSRAKLKEAAKGRTIDCTQRISAPASGGLELPVPPGAAAVRVQVSLGAAGAQRAPLSHPTAVPVPAPTRGSACEVPPCPAGAASIARVVPSAQCVTSANSTIKCESWLSIKGIQRKIAETCRKSETANKDTCKDPCQPKNSPCVPNSKPSPCAPPSKRDDPCKPTSPCSPTKERAKHPPKRNEVKKKKPTCFTTAAPTTISVGH